MCVGFALCNRDCFQNNSSKTIRLFIVFFGKSHVDVFFFFFLIFRAQIKFYTPALAFSACAYLAVKADDLCTVFTLEFMCYCDKAGGVVCVSAYGLWVFIETTDCRTAYWRTQTIFRGNAKFHEFPIPFLIASIPIWIMYVVLCVVWPLCCLWPFANYMHLVMCCKVVKITSTWDKAKYKIAATCKWLTKLKTSKYFFFLCIKQNTKSWTDKTVWK